MARKPVRRVEPAETPTPPTQSAQLERFARRLYKEMMKRDWNQSDLARAAFGQTTDAHGYKVAKGRDRISVYIRGKAVPDPRNLRKIADALGLEAEDLAGDLYAPELERENPEIAIHAVSGRHDMVHLRVNKLVSMQTASRVMALITDDAA